MRISEIPQYLNYSLEMEMPLMVPLSKFWQILALDYYLQIKLLILEEKFKSQQDQRKIVIYHFVVIYIKGGKLFQENQYTCNQKKKIPQVVQLKKIKSAEQKMAFKVQQRSELDQIKSWLWIISSKMNRSDREKDDMYAELVADTKEVSEYHEKINHFGGEHDSEFYNLKLIIQTILSEELWSNLLEEQKEFYQMKERIKRIKQCERQLEARPIPLQTGMKDNNLKCM